MTHHFLKSFFGYALLVSLFVLLPNTFCKKKTQPITFAYAKDTIEIIAGEAGNSGIPTFSGGDPGEYASYPLATGFSLNKQNGMISWTDQLSIGKYIIVVANSKATKTTNYVVVVKAGSNPNTPPSTLKDILSGGTTGKTWKLAPIVGAIVSAPNVTVAGDQSLAGTQGGAYYLSNVGDVTARSGDFDDVYTFANSTTLFSYDDKATLFTSGNSAGSYPTRWGVTLAKATGNYISPDDYVTDATGDQKLWAKNIATHTYSIIEGTGVKGLGQIKVNGKGAHLGLQGFINLDQEAYPTATTITYDIYSLQKGLVNSSTGKKYDELIVVLETRGYGADGTVKDVGTVGYAFKFHSSEY